MHDILTINTKINTYSIKFISTFNQLYNNFDDININNKDICIVSDENVSKLYMEQIIIELKQKVNKIVTFVIQPGEKSKNINTANELYDFLIKEKFDRKSILIALGGGVVGDLTGYVAATYLRGIDFIQIPTSLLAQVDSSIGGKTGIDFKGYKNMIGAFYQPKVVIINTSTLKTLPKLEFTSGMAEIIKHALIKDLNFMNWLEEHNESVQQLNQHDLKTMIYKSDIIKKEIVELDEKEDNIRALLNFGHTIGHAIEKIKLFSLTHGQCVSIGMVASAYISFLRGYINEFDLKRIESILRAYNLPTRTADINSKQIIETTKSDKKVRAHVLHFILLNTIGKADIYTDIIDEELFKAIEYIKLEV